MGDSERKAYMRPEHVDKPPESILAPCKASFDCYEWWVSGNKRKKGQGYTVEGSRTVVKLDK